MVAVVLRLFDVARFGCDEEGFWTKMRGNRGVMQVGHVTIESDNTITVH